MSDAKEKAQAFGFSEEDVRAALGAWGGNAFAMGGEEPQDFVLDLGVGRNQMAIALLLSELRALRQEIDASRRSAQLLQQVLEELQSLCRSEECRVICAA
ncbi:hypothetical protein INR38_18875 [Delftia sp. SD018]|uniref:hypothetical protein n=1 Tax=unclassified Delftia TaxID=2613839 RepID=UPI001A95AF0B|nr:MULTISPECIES: hypothetical protein [unclassified Delftia]MBO0987567.1 hypothetical protein [Delftia sp. SD083]MBO1036142.1 hypothetical protein [Delftia sp. SD018]